MKAKKHNKRSLLFFLPLVAFAMGLLLVSCSQDDGFHGDNPKSEMPKGKKVGDLVINESSVLLNAASVEKIKSFDENLLIFESEPDQASEITKGAILVGIMTNENTIENIMGKVVSVNVINNEWHVQTTPVELEEFIYSGTISGTVYPEVLDASSTKSAAAYGTRNRPMMVQDVAGFPSYTFLNKNQPFAKRELRLPRIEFDNTFPVELPVPIVDVKPSISLKAGFTPVLEYEIKFGLKGIEEFNVIIYAKDLLLESYLNAYAGLKFDLSAADLYSIPIVPIVLGPTGLIISPTVSTGPYIHAKIGTSMDVKLFHIDGEVSYTLTNPLKTPTFDLHADPYNWSNISWNGVASEAEVGMHLNTGLSLTFLASNIASVGASSKIGAGMDATLPEISRVNLKVYANVSSDARVVLGIPPLQISKGFPLIHWRPTLFETEFATGL